MASCPQCTSVRLQHALLVENLPAYSCSSCHGVLLSLIAYRRWRELYLSDSAMIPFSDIQPAAKDSSVAKVCPKCRALMTKYQIFAGVSNRLDYCDHCEDIWLDSGEWALIENLAVSGQLAKVFTQPWQTKIRSELSHKMKTDRLKQLLGKEYDTFLSFKQWLSHQEAKDEIIIHLQEGDS